MNARESLHALTSQYLEELFPSEAEPGPGGFLVRRGYLISLQPQDFIQGRAILTFTSMVCDPDTAFPESDEILRWINQANQNLWLGTLQLEGGRFVYDLRLPSECITKESFDILVRGFASLSAKLANEVRDQFE
jgi:Putative bacterial sensory transduction regulator